VLMMGVSSVARVTCVLLLPHMLLLPRTTERVRAASTSFTWAPHILGLPAALMRAFWARSCPCAGCAFDQRSMHTLRMNGPCPQALPVSAPAESVICGSEQAQLGLCNVADTA
jgi:hypothetical protein